MSKKSAMKNKSTGKRPLQALTRKQQVAALRTLKAQEVAENVAGSIRDAVKQEIELQLGSIKETMFELIDTVTKIEERVCVDEEETSNELPDYGMSSEASYYEDVRHKREQDESNSLDRQQGTEAPEIPGDPEVVQGSGIEESDDCGPITEGSPHGW